MTSCDMSPSFASTTFCDFLHVDQRREMSARSPRSEQWLFVRRELFDQYRPCSGISSVIIYVMYVYFLRLDK